MNTLNSLPFRNNCILNLQETHWTSRNAIQYHWKNGNVQSNGLTNKCGVAILYNENFFDEILEKYTDNEGRMCSLIASKDEEVYFFVNVYAPNDHYIAKTFFEKVKNHVYENVTKYPNTNLFVAGDFNIVFNPDIDAVGRSQSKQEKKVVNLVNSINTLNSLQDTYRHIHKFGGFTWGRNNPMYLRSRLDHIFADKKMTRQLITSNVTFAFQDSDHGFLFSEFGIDTIDFGPGIIRANAGLLEDDDVKARVIEHLKDDLTRSEQRGWNPHLILDHHKYILKQELLKEGKLKRNKDKSTYEQACLEIDLLSKELNEELSKINDTNSVCDYDRINSLKEAIEIAEAPIKELKEEEAKRLIFRSKAKWSEEGEKSTKYFLNLLKDRQKKMLIRKITSNGKTFYKQDEITKAISKFYKDLYKKQADLNDPSPTDAIFKELPKLDENDKNKLVEPITIDELYKTLNTCKESAPGPDGISYEVYKKTWEISGNVILNAWNHSIRIGQTSQSQREAVITLLEKKGKDKSELINLRPISLSNCDIKICTKTIALRTNMVLEKLLCTTQTGYVPGRQVTNNNRLIEEIIEMVNKSDDEAFLITLDAQKAFDSVDHKYLLEVLRAYDFPEMYVKWVKVIYTNLEASVLVNGYTTEKFRIEQSVKQGDALSCALFVLAIEPLLRNIQCNKRFSKKSGIKLNVNKTEIMVIGKKQGILKTFKLEHNEESVNIVEQDSVKICGITYSNETEKTC